MNIKIQILVAALMILSLIVIVNMIRKKQLELKYALAWLLIGVGILMLDCFPQLISTLAVFFGIGMPVNMLFFFGFVFSLVIIFVLTITVSRMSVKIQKLSQELALLEKRFEENTKK